MAGGKLMNVFKLSRADEPKEVLNWRLWLAVLTFGLCGAARGIDEGLVSGVFSFQDFQRRLHINELGQSAFANIKGNVTAMVNLGSIGGTLV